MDHLRQLRLTDRMNQRFRSIRMDHSVRLILLDRKPLSLLQYRSHPFLRSDRLHPTYFRFHLIRLFRQALQLLFLPQVPTVRSDRLVHLPRQEHEYELA